MQPEELVPLYETRHAVTPSEFQIAQAAWTAFCSPDPAGLVELLSGDTSALPFLRSALLRHLQQFPALDNGLSRTERQILHLTWAGLREFKDLFPAAQKLEEAVWMGDDTFLRHAKGLATARQPLLRSGDGHFEITTFGQRVLSGQEDHVRVNGIDRWLGGVHLRLNAPVWRWDEAARTIRLSSL
jgi:hypothetical protein